jgi:3-oxoacyl-[acyl-carrier protein] reductase
MADQERRVALVTGGSRGIGRAIALALARTGHTIALNYRARADEAAQAIAEIEGAGGAARAFAADVAAASECRRLVSDVLQGMRRIDVLVNNAGIALPGVRMADIAAQDWERVLRVNVDAPFHLVQSVLPHMRARGSGSIVNLSSNVTNRMPVAGGVYAVSKAALEAFTRILAREEGANGIRVNAVGPGPIRTEMLAESLQKMGPERAEAFVRSVPLGRMGEPEEIAAMVAFLVSDSASYVTGQVIFVNGGGPT